MKLNNNKWIFTLTIFSCILIGSFIGEILSDYFNIFEKSINLSILTQSGTPWLLDFKFLKFAFGVAINLNFGSIIFLILGIIMFYKK